MGRWGQPGYRRDEEPVDHGTRAEWLIGRGRFDRRHRVREDDANHPVGRLAGLWWVEPALQMRSEICLGDREDVDHRRGRGMGKERGIDAATRMSLRKSERRILHETIGVYYLACKVSRAVTPGAGPGSTTVGDDRH